MRQIKHLLNSRTKYELLGIPVLLFGLAVSASPQLKGSDDRRTSTETTPYSLLEPCKLAGVDSRVYCGSHEVYENRSQMKGRKIRLNIVLLRALADRPLPDPLFVFAGGPGQAATLGARGDTRRFSEILKKRDIVLVDQRGTGRSNGLKCDLGGLSGAFSAFVAGEFNHRKVLECREKLAKIADLSRYSTRDAVDDIEEVRRWLGYGKINLYGGSYGTRPVLVYLRRHGKHARTATVRGVYSIDPTYFAEDTQRSLELLFSDCRRLPECDRKYPDLGAELEKVLNKLKSYPGVVSVTDPGNGKRLVLPVTRAAFIGAIRRLLYSSSTQRFIPLMIRKASEGNYQPLEDVVRQTSGILNGFSIGMFFSVACREGILRMKPADLEKAGKGSYFGTYMAKSALRSCREWNVDLLDKGYFEPVTSDVPVLILSGEIDPVTPPRWGAAAARNLKNSLHLEMRGIAHSPFPVCALRIMSDFVESSDLGGVDTSCIGRMRREGFVLPSKIGFAEFKAADADEAAIISLEQKWLEMSASGDKERLLSLLPPGFVQIQAGSGGNVAKMGREEWIRRVVGLTTRVENGNFYLQPPSVTVKGDKATVETGWSLKGTINSRPITDTIHVIDRFEKRDGKWTIVGRKRI